MIHSQEYPFSSQSFPSDETAGVSSRTFIVKHIQFFDINCGLFMRLHFSIGCYDCRWTSRRRQSIHFSRIQVLFADDAPASTPNSLSSGLRFDGAGRHQFSEGEKKNAALFFSFNFRMLLASLHDASRAHRSCHSVSS